MAENETGQERTEQPTPKRREDARKKAQVPRSRELNTLLSLLFSSAGLFFFGASIISGLTEVLKSSFTINAAKLETGTVLSVHLVSALEQALWLATPFFALLVVGAFAGPLAMGGWAFSPSAIAFKLEKVSPLKGLKRIASAKSLMELLKALAKFLLVASIATAVIWQVFDEFLLLGRENIESSLAHLASIAAWAFLGFCIALIFIAAADVPFQLWEHTRQMRMTRQEVKDEVKETEGRPEVKSRIRQLQREMAQQRMLEDVPEASVVITNPTHYAVALKYDDKQARAPIVVAKGKDLMATKIREIAAEHSVTLFSAPPLARAIYASTEINHEIPAQLYVAVAQVLAYVYQLEQTLKPGEPRPQPPLDLPVPPELAEGVR